MNILLCGASGFIGRHIAQALQQMGHEVQAASRRSQPPIDFAQATHAAAWLPLLRGVDAVVNAVGVLRDSRAQPMAQLHSAAPRALFEACAQAGVRRVVQISALGIAHSATAYARTKREADEHLLALTAAGRLDGVVLRPSLVFGAGGASTALFMALARLPVLLLPRPVITAQVQPLAVHDLAEAVVRLLQPPAWQGTEKGAQASALKGVLELGGPQPMALGAYIANLRTQMRSGPARTLPLPDVLTRISARLGDTLPFSPWCSEAVALLEAGNVTNAATLARVLGRPAVEPEQFVQLLEDENGR